MSEEERDRASIEDSFRVAGEEMIHFVTSAISAIIPAYNSKSPTTESNNCGPGVERVDDSRVKHTRTTESH